MPPARSAGKHEPTAKPNQKVGVSPMLFSQNPRKEGFLLTMQCNKENKIL